MIPAELNDAAVIVVQLEPTDLADIKSLRDSLRQFAVFDASVIPRVRAYAQQAATALELILLGGSGDATTHLTQAGKAIDAAINAADDADSRAPHDTHGVTAAIVHDARSNSALNAAMLNAAMLDAAMAGAEIQLSPPRNESPAPDASTRSPSTLFDANKCNGGTIPGDADVALVRDFIAESREAMAGAEAALLTLEANPDDIEAINTVFRAFHTVKGTAAFMGLDCLAEFAHHAESLLSRVRDRELAYSQPVASLSLRTNDALGEFLDAVETALLTDQSITLPTAHQNLLHDLRHADDVIAGVTHTRAPIAHQGVIPVVVPETFPDAIARTARGLARSEVDLSVRVRTDRLDRLIDMVGELVIAQSMIAADSAVVASGRHDLIKKVSHAGKIMRELQELSMSMRMVPLKPTFQKLTRLVRDLALKAGKVVELVTDGEETEVDRGMVDAIADPLVHMVRNAVDHGVELPTDRERAGKPRAGRLHLSAFQQGGSVIVELRDDGRGLNRQRILAKAIERGLVSANQSLTESEINALIFAPGFSTAEQLTDVSGRGVGMDVVRRNIESIRGHIEIHSVAGCGTTFQIRMPLTLAVTDGMIVRVGGERYIVPLTSISLSFRPEPAMLSLIPPTGEVVLMRGNVLPVVRLHRLFGIANATTSPSDAILMIVGDGEERVALLVDQLLGQQQVVAKTLGDGVGEIPGISGAAILSDGRVGLIIDVARLTALARSTDQRSLASA